MPPRTRLQSGSLKRKYAGSQPESDSRWDPTPTREVDVDDLDLDISYQRDYMEYLERHQRDQKEIWARKKPAKKTWKNPNSDGTPMTDPKRLPRGWIDVEPDLEADDLEGQIVRCNERIAEGIMPYIFEKRLKYLEEVKQDTIEMKAKESVALRLAVVLRLQTLQQMLDFYQEEGDREKQVKNITAVMHAYRNDGLELTGLVTYWLQGKQLCMPRKFNWDEFEAIYKKCDNPSFWVEGLDGPQPHAMHAHIEVLPDLRNGWANTYTVQFRAPGSQKIAELEVLYDTGASVTAIFQEDLRDMAPSANMRLPVMGAAAIRSHTTTTVYPLVDLHVTVLSHTRKRMTQWCQARVAVMPGRQKARDPIMRVDGPWIRQLVYMATAPDNKRKLYMSTSGAELDIPKLANVNKAVPPGLAGVSTHAATMPTIPLGAPFPAARDIPMPKPAWNVDE